MNHHRNILTWSIPQTSNLGPHSSSTDPSMDKMFAHCESSISFITCPQNDLSPLWTRPPLQPYPYPHPTILWIFQNRTLWNKKRQVHVLEFRYDQIHFKALFCDHSIKWSLPLAVRKFISSIYGQLAFTHKINDCPVQYLWLELSTAASQCLTGSTMFNIDLPHATTSHLRNHSHSSIRTVFTIYLHCFLSYKGRHGELLTSTIQTSVSQGTHWNQ